MSEPGLPDANGVVASAGMSAAAVTSSAISSLPYAHGGPIARARLKAEPDDFIVEEVLGFEPTGAGEHAYLVVEKRGANTDWVAKQLARYAGVAPVAVGYAGLKDRHAVTRQVYTVALANKPDPDWAALEHPEYRVLSAVRHNRKLKRGALRGNRFRLRLRDVAAAAHATPHSQGDPASVAPSVDAARAPMERAALERAALERAARATLARIATFGVPNYFGEQRFGREAGNVAQARAMFEGRRVAPHERGMLLSAARSEIFNAVLARRVDAETWETALEGDVFQIDGSGSIFGPEPLDDVLRERLRAGRIHPTGPMWGRGELRTTGLVAEIERDVAASHEDLGDGLAAAGLEHERRSLRLMPRDVAFEVDGGDWRIAFELPAGSYATVVLRELIDAV